MRAILGALVGVWLSLSAAFAVQPDEILRDPNLETRARALSAGLRCMVCQNQSIDDSDAALARDLRVLLRERIAAGDSDDQVMSYLTDRYGEFILLKPRFAPHTLVLWLGPPLILGLAVLTIVFAVRRSRRDSEELVPLSAEEQARLDALMSDEKR